MDNKTKQVQVRLTPERHSQLKGKLALNGRKLVDFFNDAALAYLKNPEEYDAVITRIIGGSKNG